MEIIKAEINEQMNYCATMLLHGARGMAIKRLLGNGVLKPVSNLETSMAGVYVEY